LAEILFKNCKIGPSFVVVCLFLIVVGFVVGKATSVNIDIFKLGVVWRILLQLYLALVYQWSLRICWALFSLLLINTLKEMFEEVIYLHRHSRHQPWHVLTIPCLNCFKLEDLLVFSFPSLKTPAATTTTAALMFLWTRLQA